MAYKDNLVAWWTLDETSGDRADSAGSNTLSRVSTEGYGTGVKGNAAKFAGYLQSADNAALSLNATDFSFAFWVKFSAFTSVVNSYMIAKYNSSAEYGTFYKPSTTEWTAYVGTSTGNSVTVTSEASLDTWYFVVETWNNSTKKLRLSINNGTPAEATRNITIPDAANEFTLGTFKMANGAAKWSVNGYMDEVGIWKRVLGADEITWLYNAGAGRTYTELDATQALTAADLILKAVTFDSPTLVNAPGPTALTAKDLTLTTINFDAPHVGMHWNTPACRTYAVEAESRSLTIGAESRTLAIEAEDRGVKITCAGEDKYAVQNTYAGLIAADFTLARLAFDTPTVQNTKQVTTDSLTAYWTMDETNGTRYDSVGDNDLVDNDTVNYGLGKKDYAADFELTRGNEYFTCADNADLNFNGTDFTLTCWVKFESLPAGSEPHIISKRSAGELNLEFALSYVVNSNNFQFSIWTAGYTPKISVVSTAAVVDTWYFVVCTFNNTTKLQTISVNNATPVTTTTAGLVIKDTTEPLAIGRLHPAYSNDLYAVDGLIDEVGFWKRVLLAEEVSWLYNSGLGRTYGDFATAAPPTYAFDVNDLTSTNAVTPLTIPTYDGSGQTIHTSVYYNADGWNGYKYWMGITPYPNMNDDYENPSIVAGNDGDTWEVPIGLTNPITPGTGVIGEYNSDTELYCDGTTMYCFYRWVVEGSNFVSIRYKSSTDGVTWSDAVEAFNTTFAAKTQCPMIVYTNSKHYMFTVDYAPTGYEYGEFTMTRREATSFPSAWGSPVTCKYCLHAPDDAASWHGGIVKMTDGRFLCAMSTRTATPYVHRYIYLLSSTDDGLNWTVALNPLLTLGSAGNFDDTFIYRPTLIETSAGHFDLWYSGVDSNNHCNTGRTTISL